MDLTMNCLGDNEVLDYQRKILRRRENHGGKCVKSRICQPRFVSKTVRDVDIDKHNNNNNKMHKLH